MAESSISVSEDQFICSICLDLLKDPVTVPCGHSYCMSCITDCWDQDDQKRVYSCPQCRQTFTPRPVLGKNVLFASMVEKFQIANTVDCNAGPGDVECDVCIGRKRKAVKFCVECLDSYCQNHLKQHKNLFERKRHKLMDASGKLQERICFQHRKLQDIFCRTDQQCICLLCIMDIHKNHDTVSAGAERTEKESHLIESQKKYQQRIQEKQKELQELRDAVVTYKRSAQAAVEDSERIFTELIFLIEISCSEMTQLIRDQEKAEVSQAEEILKRLEQEINDLKKSDAEMEQLLHTDDHIHFLQSFQSLSVPPGSTDSLNITVSSLLCFDEVGKLVSRMREKLENLCTKEIKKISGRVSNVKIIGPRSRQEFLQHSFRFTMEQKTAYEYLCLSEGNRVIINNAGTLQPCPDHPDKFNVHPQVLCRESVSGRCYWEVEWSGRVDISVSYKSISRKGWGDDCFFGRNNQSWSLYCSDSTCSFWHNNIETELPLVSRSCRIGVYVDHSAGTLSFYSVSDTIMTLIHRVHTTFTQPLYPGFRLDYSATLFLLSKVKLCEINKVNISESELY